MIQLITTSFNIYYRVTNSCTINISTSYCHYLALNNTIPITNGTYADIAVLAKITKVTTS